MAVRNNFAAGEVLAAADLNDTFGAKANLASPTFTGTPAAPTAAAGTNTTQIATTAFVQAAGGMVLVASQSFSAVSAVNVDSCFSATYDVYRALFITTTASGTGNNITLQLRKSATNQANGYYGSVNSVNFLGNAVNLTTNNEASLVVNTTSTSGAMAALTVSNVNNSGYPCIVGTTVSESRVGGSVVGGVRATADSYTGISFAVASGTITGTLRIYGLRNSL